MSKELTRVVDELGREKGISREILTAALQDAVGAAVAKRIGKYLEPEINIDLDRGEIDIKIPKEVTEFGVTNWDELSMEDAAQYKEDPQLGDMIMVPVTLEQLGRQAALVSKQRLMERLRDAEKQSIMDEYQGKIGEIINGTVLKMERDNLVISVGKTEAIMPRKEMIQGEFYERGKYIRALLLDIRMNKGWPQLVLSRTHPNYLVRLFEAEIPEVFEGLIQIKAAAREPGERSKVAVYSTNSSIDPVGACIGVKGSRINSISKELKDEKIDVVEWSQDPIQFVCNAISPAQVLLTNVFEDEKTFELVVPNDQLSLAIGKRGQNVKLAAMLTEWRLDVLNEDEYQEIRKERMQEQEHELKMLYEIYNLENISSLDADMINKLREHGIDDVEKLSDASVDEVAGALEVSEDIAVSIINMGIDYLTARLEDMDEEETEGDGAEEE
ncbi:MAG: transcription termination factor NusA [Deferribacteraceae bacterium]|jgi:N utilization substance protein A|nr:transcription termination factor NusA [Deferribacteraceae bacterium]